MRLRVPLDEAEGVEGVSTRHGHINGGTIEASNRRVFGEVGPVGPEASDRWTSPFWPESQNLRWATLGVLDEAVLEDWHDAELTVKVPGVSVLPLLTGRAGRVGLGLGDVHGRSLEKA